MLGFTKYDNWKTTEPEPDWDYCDSCDAPVEYNPRETPMCDDCVLEMFKDEEDING